GTRRDPIRDDEPTHVCAMSYARVEHGLLSDVHDPLSSVERPHDEVELLRASEPGRASTEQWVKASETVKHLAADREVGADPDLGNRSGHPPLDDRLGRHELGHEVALVR